MSWMNSDSWFDWLVAHHRDGENLYQSGDRLITTFAFLRSRGNPVSNGNYRLIMSDMLFPNVDGDHSASIHRKIHKYGLMEIG